MTKTRTDLFALLDDLGIAHATVEHLPLHTVEESRALRGELPGGHAKNLLVKDKKSRVFLVVAREDLPLDLKKLHGVIGAQGRVSFCSAEQMGELLGVAPGSVTPFGLFNDTAHVVTVVLDEGLLALDPLNFHPLENTATTTIARDDLLRFLDATGHAPIVVALPLATETAE